MTTTDILTLTQETASRLGISISDPATISRELRLPGSAASIICSRRYTLWIDNHYLAYGNNAKPEFTYVFCDSDHAGEELRRVNEMIVRVQSCYALTALRSVREQLRRAEAAMNESGDEIYFFDQA